MRGNAVQSDLDSESTIALDATFSVGSGLSGVGVYSREILNGLAASGMAGRWDWFYRSPRYWKALRLSKPANVSRLFLSDSWGNRRAALFHGLNQRLPRRRFLRQIATFHDLFVLSGVYSTPEFRERFAAQAREAASGADLIIAVSEFTAGQVERYLKVPRSRIRVVHHGVLPRVTQATMPRQKVVLCVGAIQRRKNQAGLVRAFRAMPADWKLILAGSQGYEADEVLAEIAKSPRRDDIRITGYLTDEEIGHWYAKASIFAFPSFDEGFGMPVLEAMTAGVPVIAGNRSALPEVCGDAAMLVDPENDDELANALTVLAQDTTFGEELSRRGKIRAAEFNWTTAVAETAAVYKELG